MVKLADTQDLGSCGKPWGFESLHPHQRRRKATFITASAIACRLFLRLRLLLPQKTLLRIFNKVSSICRFFNFKGLEVAPQPKMLCILPPLVGCTLEQVLAVSESLRRRKPTSFIARRCLAPLSVAFSSFVKTKFCRIFPIQTTAPFLMLPFIARQVLSLAPPLSPKQISASLPRFVCFILTKKIPAIIGGIFIAFANSFKVTLSCCLYIFNKLENAKIP